MKNKEKGFALIEIIVAIALLGIIGVAFLGGLSTASKALFLADERTTAESLARSEMEYVKKQDYDNTAPYTYAHGFVSSTSHPDYTIKVEVDPLDTSIQQITVTVNHRTETIITLEDYKVDR